MVNFLSVLLVVVGTFIGSIGALVIKKGLNRYNFKHFLLSRYFFGGFSFYVISVLFYFIALKREELSVVYPLVSTSYIWVTVLSVCYLKEKIDVWKIVSLIGIIIGVILIGLGS